jgi:hypothetical protein
MTDVSLTELFASIEPLARGAGDGSFMVLAIHKRLLVNWRQTQ